MATHSSTIAWKIPWTEKPGGLQSMGSRRVQHNWVTSLSRIGEGNGNPLQCSCLENPRDGGAWWAAVYGVAQSRTRLKRLSSSSSSIHKMNVVTKFLCAWLFISTLYLWGPLIRQGTAFHCVAVPRFIHAAAGVSMVMFLGTQVYASPMCASKDGTASMHMLCFSWHHQAVFQSHHPSTLPSAIHEDSSCFVHACSCPTLCDPMDCSLPGSSVPGTFQQEY